MKSQQRGDYWRQHMTAWQTSCLSGQRFCQQQQLNYRQFVYWRQKFRTATDNQSPGFAKVTTPATVVTASAELTLSLPNGLVISVFTVVGLDTLRVVGVGIGQDGV
jgi:hypothetical protein